MASLLTSSAGSKRSSESITPFAEDQDDALADAVDVMADDGWGSDEEGDAVVMEQASFSCGVVPSAPPQRAGAAEQPFRIAPDASSSLDFCGNRSMEVFAQHAIDHNLYRGRGSSAETVLEDEMHVFTGGFVSTVNSNHGSSWDGGFVFLYPEGDSGLLKLYEGGSNPKWSFYVEADGSAHFDWA
jgi:hypothetical protein